MDSDKPEKLDISHMFASGEGTFDFYSCKEAIDRLNGYLDHELSADERQDVVKHLNICKPCFERFLFEEKLITELRVRVSNISAPDALKERLRSIFGATEHDEEQHS